MRTNSISARPERRKKRKWPRLNVMTARRIRRTRILIFVFNSVSVLNMMRTVFTVLVLATVAMAQRRLALPDPRSCSNRVRHATYRDARGVAHSYFFSWEHQPTRSLEVDWLDARNICRRHCMDAVSLETPQENEFIKQRLARGNVRFIWTSGRKCNFAGCDRPGETRESILIKT